MSPGASYLSRDRQIVGALKCLNGPLPSCLSPLFQSEAKYKAFYLKISLMYLQILVHLHVIYTNFHIRGFALSLILKQSRQATRKSPVWKVCLQTLRQQISLSYGMEFLNRNCACLHAALPQKPARVLETSYMLCANSFQSLLENTANFRQEFAWRAVLFHLRRWRALIKWNSG